MKKRIFLFVVGLLLLCGLAFLVFSEQSSNRKLQNSTYHLTLDEKARLQEGDIIFRRGFGIISDAIAKYVPSRFPVSHCGIVVKDSLKRLMVIHTVSNTLAAVDGMQQDSLDKFVKESRKNSIIVVRYRSKEDAAAKKIADQAKKYLSQKIPFDHHFDCEDSTAFFCTELIYRVLNNAAGINIYDDCRKKKLDCTQFDVFFNPERFSTVLNHYQTDRNK
jgi:hypothetical protein